MANQINFDDILNGLKTSDATKFGTADENLEVVSLKGKKYVITDTPARSAIKKLDDILNGTGVVFSADVTPVTNGSTDDGNITIDGEVTSLTEYGTVGVDYKIATTEDGTGNITGVYLAESNDSGIVGRVDTLESEVSSLTSLSFSRKVVESLPTEHIKNNVIYMVKSASDINTTPEEPDADEKGYNVYNEYIFILNSDDKMTSNDYTSADGNWELIGNTHTDLVNYVKITDLNKTLYGTGTDKVSATEGSLYSDIKAVEQAIKDETQNRKNADEVAAKANAEARNAIVKKLVSLDWDIEVVNGVLEIKQLSVSEVDGTLVNKTGNESVMLEEVPTVTTQPVNTEGN